MKESVLIRKCRKLNKSAQQKMVELYSDALYNVCIRYVRDEFLAQDCLQESWIQIFWSLDKYDDIGKWESWIKMVTINKCREILRREGRWESSEVSIEVDEERNQEEVIIAEETVNMFLDSLPQRYRLVVNLYLVEGYSHREIADYLEVNESSARSLYSRALKMLRKKFKEPMEKPEKEAKILSATLFKQAII